MSEKSLKFVLHVRPSFHDCDPMGVVWHGSYIRFFERAREALFKTLDYDYHTMSETGFVWPVVDMRVKYKAPLLIDTEADVSCEIVEYENRLVLKYVVTDESGAVLTEALIKHMAYDLAKKESLFVSPRVLFEKLGRPCPYD